MKPPPDQPELTFGLFPNKHGYRTGSNSGAQR